MEAFAGMLTHTDAQIGRLIEYLEQSEQLDNTVIVFLSDNGASAEGGVYGRFNANRSIGGNLGGRADQLVTAYIHRDSKTEDGVIYSYGQRFGGFSFYIKDNKLKYVYNANKFSYFVAESKTEIPIGEVEIPRLTYMTGFTSALLANYYSPVTEDYQVPFAFKGKAKKIILQQFATEIDPVEKLKKLSSIE